MTPTTTLVFETHSWTEDNERGIATGWNHGQLSTKGRQLAKELGERRRDDGLAVVFTSDLARAVETVTIAFEGSDIAVLHDWRLRECDYGVANGTPAVALHQDRRKYLDVSYAGGESWRQSVARVGRFLGDVSVRWGGQRVLVVGHVATRWGLEHYINGTPLEDLVDADFAWQEGWEYQLTNR
jgi:Fructose-2,6-bisphosphatase